jgi:hypothetical protein
MLPPDRPVMGASLRIIGTLRTCKYDFVSLNDRILTSPSKIVSPKTLLTKARLRADTPYIMDTLLSESPFLTV